MDGLFDTFKSQLAKVSHVFSRHGGACDVIVMSSAGGDQIVSSSWNVHTSYLKLRGQEAQARLSVGGVPTDLNMNVLKDELWCCFGIKDSLRPSQESLNALLPILKRGRNTASFTVWELNSQTMRWEEGQSISFDIFLWGADDAIVCCDFEGVIVKTDAWSKGEEVIKHVKGTSAEAHRAADCSAMREGIGEFLSSLDRAGYKIVVLTMTPITKADKVRKTLREISDHEKAKWGNGAALPHAPVFATSDHTANVFVKKLADKALGAAGVANRASFKRGVIGEISSLFEVLNSQHEGGADSLGGLRGGLCESAADAQVFVEAGVPQASVLLVDRVGKVRQLASDKDEKEWGSFAEVPLGELFPRRYD